MNNGTPRKQHHPSNNGTSFDENLNPTPSKLTSQQQQNLAPSIRHQFQAQIVDRFKAHHSLLRYIRLNYQKPLKPLLTSQQNVCLFGNLKELLALHEKINKQLSQVATPTKDGDDSRFEKCLARIFTGKLGHCLEEEYAVFCSIKRGELLNLITSLQEDAKLRPHLEAQFSSDAWGDQNLFDLLESVTNNYMSQYPLLLDQLLQETPLNTMAYLHLEQALNGARQMSKVIAEAKDYLSDGPNMKRHRKQSFLQTLLHSLAFWSK